MMGASAVVELDFEATTTLSIAVNSLWVTPLSLTAAKLSLTAVKRCWLCFQPGCRGGQFCVAAAQSRDQPCMRARVLIHAHPAREVQYNTALLHAHIFS